MLVFLHSSTCALFLSFILRLLPEIQLLSMHFFVHQPNLYVKRGKQAEKLHFEPLSLSLPFVSPPMVRVLRDPQRTLEIQVLRIRQINPVSQPRMWRRLEIISTIRIPPIIPMYKSLKIPLISIPIPAWPRFHNSSRSLRQKCLVFSVRRSVRKPMSMCFSIKPWFNSLACRQRPAINNKWLLSISMEIKHWYPWVCLQNFYNRNSRQHHR